MPKKPEKPTVKINDPKVNAWARTYRALANDRKVLDEKEKEAKQMLGEAIEGYVSEHGVARFVTGNVTVNVIPLSGGNINGTRLLELGVTPEVIAQATDSWESVRYDVRIKED